MEAFVHETLKSDPAADQHGCTYQTLRDHPLTRPATEGLWAGPILEGDSNSQKHHLCGSCWPHLA